MVDLLEALGWRSEPIGSIRFVALLTASTLAILAAAYAVSAAISVPVVLVQALIWLGWLIWLGAIFPGNSRRDAESPCERPYRRAFMREILLGISVAFSQFLRPAVTGIAVDGSLSDPDVGSMLGVPLLVSGGVLIAAGAAVLGVARVLFVYEYVDGEQLVVRSGIYRFLRHPLFLGGVLLSLGLALLTGGEAAVELAILNAAVLPLYIRLEDRRCSRVLGREYVDYSLAVGSVVPHLRSWITSVAQLQDLAGRIDPRIGRMRVRRR
jgi:protein-S-isoprenylcysteine O-methyltransferase Ste14